MTIQRYDRSTGTSIMLAIPDGEYVTHADHIAALAAAQETNLLEIEGFKKRVSELEIQMKLDADHARLMQEAADRSNNWQANRIEDLECQLTEAKKDSERLTWLIKQGPIGAQQHDVCLSMEAFDVAAGLSTDLSEDTDQTLIRAAIDAAKKENA